MVKLSKLESVKRIKIINAILNWKGKTSKRIPCKRRYKIEKRIKAHNKKLTRENKKNGKSTTKSGSKLKDFHIPNKCPFKNELLNQAEEMKKQVIYKNTKNKNKILF